MENEANKPTQTRSLVADWPYSVRLISAVLWIFVGLGLIFLARPMWYLIALAMIIAYLLQPLIERMSRVRFPRALSAALLVLFLIVLVSLLPIILVPALFADVAPISIDFNALWNSVIHWINHLPTTYPGVTLLGFQLDFGPFYDEFFSYIDSFGSAISIGMPANLGQFIQDAVSSATQVVGVATIVATNVIGRITSVVFNVVLFVLLTFYLTIDLPRFHHNVVSLAPDDYQPEWQELWRRTGKIWQSFFRGQILLSLVVGTTVWLGLSIIGVPGALVLGILAGVLEVIPNLGPVLAMIPAFLLALLQGSTNYPDLSHLTIALIVIALYVVIQQLENYILVPRILGGSVGVHPVVILIAVTVFTIRFGLLGAFIATPTIATIQVWFSYYHARILGREPYQIPNAEPEPPPTDAETSPSEAVAEPERPAISATTGPEASKTERYLDSGAELT